MIQIYENKTQKIFKDKDLNNANFGNYTLNDYQVFLHLISKLGGVDECGKYLQPQQLKREHVLTAKEFSEAFNTDINSSYKKLQKACKKLMKTSIVLNKLESKHLWEINVCSSALYNQGEGRVTIKFTDDILPYLSQVRDRFVLYNLKEISSFRSIYTTRLYELVQEFKETGWMVRSVDQLRNCFAVGNKFKHYNDLKRKTFGHACKEINDTYGLDLQFEEIKEGRKVVAIRFTFNKTKIHKAINPKTGKSMNIYEKPKPRSKSDVSNLPEVLEGQMDFDDLGDVVQGFADNLKQKRSEKF